MAATGRCLCGAVRFEVNGQLRDVVLCRCGECRRWAGHVWAATAAHREDLRVARPARLLRRVRLEPVLGRARQNTVSIAAGALDPPTGLRATREIYTEYAGDYYELDSPSRPGSP